MNKFFLVSIVVMVVFLNFSVLAQHKMPPEVEECKTKEGVTDEDFKSFRNPDQPKSPAMMCFMTCMAEKHEMIANNQLNAAAILSFVKTLRNYSSEMDNTVKEILDECKSITDPNRCSFGSKVMTCLKDGAKKRGLDSVFMPHGRS